MVYNWRKAQATKLISIVPVKNIGLFPYVLALNTYTHNQSESAEVSWKHNEEEGFGK